MGLTHCTFTDNEARYGGGIYFKNGSIGTVTNCEFTGNSAAKHGGGLTAESSDVTVSDCLFSGNSAFEIGVGAGGAIHNGGGTLAVLNCTFIGNSAVEDGGAVQFAFSSPTVTNCLFTGNTSEVDGGAIWSQGAPKLTNCTFSGNSANGAGGGIRLSASIGTRVDNCVFWGNTDSGPADESSQILVTFGSPAVTFTDIMDLVLGGPFCPDVSGDPLTCDNGNIAVDPLFAGAGSGNLHIKPGSPCIDAADNNVPGLDGIETDLDGVPRFLDDPDTDDTGLGSPEHPFNFVDMGTYEFQLCPGGSGTCPADLNLDSEVGPFDLAALLAAWGLNPGHAADFNCDAFVGAADLPVLLAAWGTCPP